MIPVYTKDDAARLAREQADDAENENYHEFVEPLYALANTIEAMTERTLVVAMGFDGSGPELHKFYVQP